MNRYELVIAGTLLSISTLLKICAVISLCHVNLHVDETVHELRHAIERPLQTTSHLPLEVPS